jgi:hypothetical protein
MSKNYKNNKFMFIKRVSISAFVKSGPRFAFIKYGIRNKCGPINVLFTDPNSRVEYEYEYGYGYEYKYE